MDRHLAAEVCPNWGGTSGDLRGGDSGRLRVEASGDLCGEASGDLRVEAFGDLRVEAFGDLCGENSGDLLGGASGGLCGEISRKLVGRTVGECSCDKLGGSLWTNLWEFLWKNRGFSAVGWWICRRLLGGCSEFRSICNFEGARQLRI